MFRGIVPYMLLQLLAIAVVVFFPQIALWLPEKLIGWN
jgi:TRAP-type mannitol/chloroaromatic compound transport system permease large subunit